MTSQTLDASETHETVARPRAPKTIPALPCVSIDDTLEFWSGLGFAITYRQKAPNPYGVVKRDGYELHFFGLKGLDPTSAFSTCFVMVPDVETVHAEFAASLTKTLGRSPAKGGRDHSSHRLVAIGLSERDAVLVLWALASVGGGIGLLLRNFSPDWSLPVGGVFLVAMCAFAVYLARVRVYEDLPPGQITDGFTLLQSNFMNRRRVVEVLFDATLIGASYYWATGLVFPDPEAYLRNADVFYQSLPIVVAVQLIAFFARGLYRGIWQPFVRNDVHKVLESVLAGTVIAQVFLVAYYGYFAVSWKVVLLQALMIVTGVILSRLIGRMFPP